MPSQVTLKDLLEVGVHFGHRTQKWNPKMAPYIFTARNGIHILNLQQTIRNVHEYHDLVRDLIAGGGVVLFVGTKRQAAETIRHEALRCGMPYINHRWLGGMLTNWTTIRKRIDQLKKLEQRREAGEFAFLPKKEALMLEREIEKLQLRLGGIRNLKRLPDVVFIVDTIREATAIKECNNLHIPVMALVDSNCDPDVVDYILPANDDAMRAIKLMVSAVAAAVLEGRSMRKDGAGDDDDFEMFEEVDLSKYDAVDTEEVEVDDEVYLGKSTLEKIRTQRLLGVEEEV
ncbi:MAG: 30S ribosomal protein S2 [Phototrophicaceae bacterium]|jgi:small subunit ribosomal protein S2